MNPVEFPLWGQLSLLGLSLGLNVWFIVRIAMGLLVPYNRVEEANANVRVWQDAWKLSEQTKREATEMVLQLTVTAKTMEKVLNALPPIQTANVIVTHDDGNGRA